MAKALAEQSYPISIFWLKKNYYLIPKQFGGGVRSGAISWVFGTRKSTIKFLLATNMQEVAGMGDYIRLHYTPTYQLKEGEIDFKVSLTTTPCNYGGVRYWFVCPLCGNQVGVIYSVGKYFGCRKCGNIAYMAQMEGGKYRFGSVSIPDIEQARKEVKRLYYNGRKTRKYLRVIRLSEKLNNTLAEFVGRYPILSV